MTLEDVPNGDGHDFTTMMEDAEDDQDCAEAISFMRVSDGPMISEISEDTIIRFRTFLQTGIILLRI